MTISEHITQKTLELDMGNLTEKECDWLHFMNRLAMWAMIPEAYRKMRERRKAA